MPASDPIPWGFRVLGVVGIILVWTAWALSPGAWWARTVLALGLNVPWTIGLWPWRFPWQRSESGS